MLFKEALEHVPDNAIMVEIAPHSLLQAVLKRALANTCTIVGLMDKRQPDNLLPLFTALGKYVCVDFYYSLCKYRTRMSIRVNKVLGIQRSETVMP